jgi:hypothetical protein
MKRHLLTWHQLGSTVTIQSLARRRTLHRNSLGKSTGNTSFNANGVSFKSSVTQRLPTAILIQDAELGAARRASLRAVARVGNGSYGSVLKARHRHNGSIVAIKSIKSDTATCHIHKSPATEINTLTAVCEMLRDPIRLDILCLLLVVRVRPRRHHPPGSVRAPDRMVHPPALCSRRIGVQTVSTTKSDQERSRTGSLFRRFRH